MERDHGQWSTLFKAAWGVEGAENITHTHQACSDGVQLKNRIDNDSQM